MKKHIFFLSIIIGFLALVFPAELLAHDVVKDLENMSTSEAATTYVSIGYQHILPLGFDHILFIISLVIASKSIKQLIAFSTIFTVGHCITLGLATYGIFGVSPTIIEPLIAISIIYVAAENIYFKNVKKSRYVVVLLFGLLHGMGFAGALSEIGLPQNAYLLSLLMFNIGVELGQLSIIIFSFFIIKKIRTLPQLNWPKVAVPISGMIVMVGFYWLIERLIA
jgi:hypothetical protein